MGIENRKKKQQVSVEYYSQYNVSLTLTVFTVKETSVLQTLPATGLPFFFLFKALAVSCFFPWTSKLPPTNSTKKDEQQVNMTEGCMFSHTHTLPRAHKRVLVSCSPRENTSLTSLLTCKKGIFYLAADTARAGLF